MFVDHLWVTIVFSVPVVVMLGLWGDMSYREYRQARSYVLQSFP
jgi:hypothetical protein